MTKAYSRPYEFSPRDVIIDELYKTKKYISKDIEKLAGKIEILPFNYIESEEIQNILLIYLNNRELFNEYLDIAYEFYIFKEVIKQIDYKVVLDNGYFVLIIKNKNYRNMYKELKIILFANYALTILSGYYGIKLSEYCNSNIFTNELMQTILHHEYEQISKDKNSVRFNHLLRYCEFPNFGELYDKNYFKQILNTREKAYNLRKLIYEMKDEDSINNIREYNKKLKEEIDKYNSLPIKTIAFLLGFTPIGQAVSTVDTFFKDKIINTINKNKSVRLDNVFERNKFNIDDKQ